jgi:glycosyltransferase involved in cell wall biosynthesis
MIHCVVPTLNAAATLERTLQSLLVQRGVALGFTVMDSGSTDATLAICERLGVTVQFVEAGNMYRAINHGLRGVQTEWLAYLNADDVLTTNAYARLLALAEATQADVVYGNCEYVNGQDQRLYSFAAAHSAQLLSLFRTQRMGFAQPAAIFRRSLYKQLGGFDESYRFKADADFFMRALLADARFARLSGQPVARFRLHAAQLSQRQAAVIAEEGERLFKPFQPDWQAQVALRAWQLRNVPNYLERIARASWAAGRLRMPRALEAGN